jgi:hypothetical protein
VVLFVRFEKIDLRKYKIRWRLYSNKIPNGMLGEFWVHGGFWLWACGWKRATAARRLVGAAAMELALMVFPKCSP